MTSELEAIGDIATGAYCHACGQNSHIAVVRTFFLMGLALLGLMLYFVMLQVLGVLH